MQVLLRVNIALDRYPPYNCLTVDLCMQQGQVLQHRQANADDSCITVSLFGSCDTPVLTCTLPV